MRNYLRTLVAAAGLGLSMLATVTPVFAQVIPSGSTSQRRPSPRYFNTQQVHYIRSTISFNMCTQVTNTCTVQLANAALPYNSVILRVEVALYTAFNSTTSDVLILGTTSAAANQIVSSSINLQTSAPAQVTGTVLAGALTAVGGTTAQSGQEGGFDIWAKWTAGTGNTATAGLASIIIEYIPGNDGNCAPVPLGATAAGC